MHGHIPDHARRPWTPLILLAVAQFMVVLDITVVNVALPSIGEDLRFAGNDLQWVVTIYVLLTGGLLLLGGRLADVFPRRSVFIAGLSLFTGASLASGLAQSGEMLIASRAAQGVGAALLTPGALSIVTSFYTGRQLTAALAAWSAIGSAGAAIGVLVGGMLTTWLSWEWIFLVNVPIGIAAVAAAPRVLPQAAGSGPRRRGLDLRGALLVVAGLVTLVYAFEGASDRGWGSAGTLGLIALALGLLAAFAHAERRTREPLVPPSIWRVRSLIGGAAVVLGVTGLLVGTFFLNSIYLQRATGASALETGLSFLPLALAIGLAAHLAPRMMTRIGSRWLIVIGMTVVAGGTVLLAAAPDQASYGADLLPGLLGIGVGVGFVFPAASVTAMSDVAPAQTGLAAGVLSTAHELGAALGVAVLAAIAAVGNGEEALAAGYENAYIAAAAIALAFAVVAASVVPSVKPAPGARAAVH
jgi:EmrB/QacA subfamily drug resistance transporter